MQGKQEKERKDIGSGESTSGTEKSKSVTLSGVVRKLLKSEEPTRSTEDKSKAGTGHSVDSNPIVAED